MNTNKGPESPGCLLEAFFDVHIGSKLGSCDDEIYVTWALTLADRIAEALQGETKRESEGHLYRYLCHRIMETHVEFLRYGFEQHPPEIK